VRRANNPDHKYVIRARLFGTQASGYSFYILSVCQAMTVNGKSQIESTEGETSYGADVKYPGAFS